ncbi:MAG: HAMP domain-containing sensor histidine kinase [Pseudomonadota bacterium]
MGERSVASTAAEYLEDNASQLVEKWIGWVRSRVPTDTVAALAQRALRNHIPPVLVSLARYLDSPIELARSELRGHLKLHGQIRRDQGYSLEEVLAEFDGLSHVVTEAVVQGLSERMPGASASDVFDLANRLSIGLRSISYIAMATYSQSDRQRSHQIAANLEDLSRAITHELRNPLNTLALGVQIIRENVDTSEIGDHLGAMDKALKRCLYLIDTMRILTVAENARSGDQMVDLDEAIRRVVKEFSRSASAANVTIEVEGDLPELRVESVLLYIVLANVLSNSIKYLDPAKEESWVHLSARYVDEKHDSGFCELTIEDNGLGIAAEFLPRVTQKGFRAHPSVAQGTGIGLYLVEQSLAARGGSLEVTSEEGQGTTTTVQLRCLHPDGAHLTADQFRVEHLIGEAIWNEVTDYPSLGKVQTSGDDDA